MLLVYIYCYIQKQATRSIQCQCHILVLFCSNTHFTVYVAVLGSDDASLLGVWGVVLFTFLLEIR